MLYNPRMEPETESLIRQLASGATVPAAPGLAGALETLGIGHTEEAGYIRLSRTLELLDATRIDEGLSDTTRSLLGNLRIFWSIDSTNTWLLERARDKGFHGTVCLAEQQLAGKGRRGRHWVSPFGRNIYLSLGWQMSTGERGIGGLSLMVGMQVVSALRAAGLQAVGLKWPNDVLLDRGKLAGILVEMAVPRRGQAMLVIGVGVNLSLDDRDAAAIDQPFSTVSQQRQLPRNALVGGLIDRIVPALRRFEETGFEAWMDRWDEFDVYKAKPVQVKLANGTIEGVNMGVDRDGNLLLRTGDGIQPFSAGEVSLRLSS